MTKLILLGLFLISFSLTSLANSPTLRGIKKVSFIYVGPSKGISESSFGHAALRLSPQEVPGILDLVVEFVADIPQNELAVKKYIKGIGIGGKYPMFTGISAFYDFKKLKTISEDRPLTVYELNLNQEEVDRILTYINNFKDHVNEESYSFFKKNCAYFALLAIEKGIQKEIPSKSFPWKGPKKLESLRLISIKNEYPAASSERERFSKKYLEDGLSGAFPDISWSDHFLTAIKDMNLSIRMTSYLKLLWILQSSRTSSYDKKKAQALFRYLISHEDDSSAYVLKSMFKNPEKKRVIFSMPYHLNDFDSQSSLPFIINPRILEKKGKVFISAEWINTRKGSKEGIQFQQPHLYYLIGSEIVTFQNKKIGRFIEIDNERVFLSQRFEYSIEFDRVRKKLQLFTFINLDDDLVSPRKDLETYKSLSHLALNNSLDFKGEMGSCYAMVLLQKAFLERAIFVPDIESNDKENKIEILQQLLQGNYVVIPGFSNINDFTSSINKEEFKKFVRDTQKRLEKNPFLQAIENITQREEIDLDNFQKIKNLSDEGIVFPLIIAMTHKGTKKVASPYAHAVLLLGVEQLTSGSWRLMTYDPNTNINTLFVLDKNFKLQYPFYDNKYDYIPILDILDEDQIQLDHAVRSRTLNRDLVEQSTQSGKTMIFDPKIITQILKF